MDLSLIKGPWIPRVNVDCSYAIHSHLLMSLPLIGLCRPWTSS